ncbi:SAC3/GANP/Nin1/mts3/eIF-3 p25 family-domain-containing protein [Dichotomocladium elegans]|nr:SAC3/GANP/Nin1/mts3/eIF-3 p25 family-domain-containing protein [Dichotomocladium elegans]
MCPQFEQVEREVQNMLDPFELDDSGQGVNPDRAVKRYRRSAAGNEQPLPSDVRPPHVLKFTLDYLFNDILMNYPLIKCHGFLWDRTRGIRQDFTLQNIRDESAVELHERIARFHILSRHELSNYDDEKFSEQQETEQLRKVLLSLMEFYDDLREQGIETKNEAEFRAYHMIIHIHDHGVARRMMGLPRHILHHPLLQRALKFYELVQRNNEIMETSERRNKFTNIEASPNMYSRVFKLVGDPHTSFLLAAMVEWHFPDIRKGALKAMNKAYNFHHRGVEVEYLRQVLGYDSVKHLLSDAECYGLVFDVSPTQTTIKFGQRTKGKRLFFVEPLSNPRPTKSMLLVDPKKGNRTFQQIVDGEGTEPYISTIQNIYQTLPSKLPSNGGPVLNHFQQDEQRIHKTSFVANKHMTPAQLHIQKQQAFEEEKARLQKRIRELEERKLLEQQQRLHQAQSESLRMEEDARKREQQREAEEQARREQQMEEVAAQRAREEQNKVEREQRLEALRKQAIASIQQHKRKRREEVIEGLGTQLTEEMLDALLEEESRIAALKTVHTMRLIKRRLLPRIARIRRNLEERRNRVVEENNVFELLSRLSKLSPNLGSDNPSNQKSWSLAVKQCLFAEGSALLRARRRSATPQHVWDTENVALKLYRYLQPDSPITARSCLTAMWHMYIHVDRDSPESLRWIIHKFGLDEEFMRRVERIQGLEIGIRAVYPESPLYNEAVSHTGAVIFALSELRETADGDDEFDLEYWRKQKSRITNFTSRLLRERPNFRTPFLFMYWPRTASLKETISKVDKTSYG